MKSKTDHHRRNRQANQDTPCVVAKRSGWMCPFCGGKTVPDPEHGEAVACEFVESDANGNSSATRSIKLFSGSNDNE